MESDFSRSTERDAELLDLLHRLDDPDQLEQPRGYTSGKSAVPFTDLVHRLEAAFGTRCFNDRDAQDSSEYGRVEVPAGTTVCGTRIVVSISKFGSLAMVAAENPGAFLGTADAQEEGELDAGDLAKVEDALAAAGYVVVPEELLSLRYDGPTDLYWHGSGQPTWYDRFFGIF